MSATNGGTIFGSLIGAAFDGMGTLVNSGSIYAGKIRACC